MPLQIEHRPKTLEDLVGNKDLKASLESIFARKSDFPHAFLFHGPTGCGKTTIARIIAESLQCDPSALMEYNTATLRGIDTVRAIMEECVYKPMVGNVRVYILDEIHRQTKDAKEALLKLLEDPPAHVYFILCTTMPQELPDTLRGRCHTFQVKPLMSTDMMVLLKSILKKEKIEDYPESILREIIRLAEGHPRNALVLLDSVIDMLDEESAVAALSSVSLSEVDTKALCNAILKGESWDSVRKDVQAMLATGEPENIRYAILGYLSAVLYGSKKNDRCCAVMDIFSENTYSTGKFGLQKMIYAALELK